MVPKAILFDMDGTIVDTEEMHRRAYNQTFVEFGLGWDWTPDVYEQLLQVSGGEDRIRHYIGTLALSKDVREQMRHLAPSIHRAKTRLYGEMMSEGTIEARPGIKRLIAEARAQGTRIGVVASSAAPNVQAIIASVLGNDPNTAVDAVVSGAHVQRRKPAPDLYITVLSMLGLRGESCVAIEDSANGIAAAKGASLFTIAVPSRWTGSQNFSAADIVLSSLGEPSAPLPPADAAQIRGAKCVGLAEIRGLLSSRPPVQERA